MATFSYDCSLKITGYSLSPICRTLPAARTTLDIEKRLLRRKITQGAYGFGAEPGAGLEMGM